MVWEEGRIERDGHVAPMRGGWRLALVAALATLGLGLAVLPSVTSAVLLTAIAVTLVAVSRPTWLIAFAFASIPLQIFVLDVGNVGLAPVQMVTILAAVLFGVEMLATGRFETPRTSLDVWVFLWLAVGFLGAIGAHDPTAAIKKAGMTVFFAVLYYFVVAKVRRIETIPMLMKVLTASCVTVGAYGIWVSYQYLALGEVVGGAVIVGSEGLAVPRAGSTLGNPTVLGGLMVIGVPIAVMLIATTKGWQRIAAIVSAAVIIVTLGFTFTRGAWLGGAVALLILVLERKSRNVLVGVVLLVALLSPGAVLDRATSSTQLGRAEISHRFDYWAGAVLIGEQYPLFGAGIDNFRYAFARLPVPQTATREVGHPHNLALDLFAETGMVGLISFGALMVGSLVMLLRRRRFDPNPTRRIWRLAIAAAIIGSLVEQTTDSMLLEPFWNAVMWIFFGLAVVMATRLTDDHDQRPVEAGTQA